MIASAYNYAQWTTFGSSGLTTTAERDEQRKMAHCLIWVAAG